METVIRNVSETNDLVSWMKRELVTHEWALESTSFTTEFLGVPSLIPVIMPQPQHRYNYQRTGC